MLADTCWHGGGFMASGQNRQDEQQNSLSNYTVSISLMSKQSVPFGALYFAPAILLSEFWESEIYALYSVHKIPKIECKSVLVIHVYMYVLVCITWITWKE